MDIQLGILSDLERDRSRHVESIVIEKIRDKNGWIDFPEYLNIVLYHPDVGYYSSRIGQLGGIGKGDFITAPEISPLFGKCIARQLVEGFSAGLPHVILEAGPGNGTLAVTLLEETKNLGAPIQQYFILETSSELKKVQKEKLAAFPQVVWIDNLPTGFQGVVLANEVLDALPFSAISRINSEWYERGVIENKNEQLDWGLKAPLDKKLLERAKKIEGTHNYETEICLESENFLRALASMLSRGLLIVIDYGFSESELYHHQRVQGTLNCYRQHHHHGNPFFMPGLCDITAHQNFTALVKVASEQKVNLVGYTAQGKFLLASGILEMFSEYTKHVDIKKRIEAKSQLLKLIEPYEMGEIFKVAAWAKDVDINLSGFTLGQQSKL